MLTVIGGTGAVGAEVVRQAVAGGYVVNVMRGRRSADTVSAAAVTYVDGDLRDAASVDRAVAPARTVVCTLRHHPGAPHDFLTRVTRCVVDAMDRHDLTRIIVLGGDTLRTEQDEPSARQRLQRRLR